MVAVDVPVLIALAVIGLVGGVGITALGPGGVLPTVGLFTLTGLSPSAVAGTAIVTHVGTGLLGSAVYARSGQLRDRETRRVAIVLCMAAVLGTPLGVLLNRAASPRLFGVVLGVLVALAALLVVWRGRLGDAGRSHPVTTVVAVLGLGVAVASGLVGIGGPMLTVPMLIGCGAPVLESLASAQAQSVVIAGIGSIGYLASGAIDWRLALVVGVPEMAGVVLGWVIARRLPTRVLTRLLVVVLLCLAPYVALHG